MNGWPLLALCWLAACTTPIVRLDPVIEHAPPVSLPSVAPLALNPVRWQIMTSADIKALAAKPSREPLFALDSGNYESLALNFVEIKRFLSEQKALVALLKKVVEQQSGVLQPPQIPLQKSISN